MMFENTRLVYNLPGLSPGLQPEDDFHSPAPVLEWRARVAGRHFDVDGYISLKLGRKIIRKLPVPIPTA
jgi:hypothetical protein